MWKNSRKAPDIRQINMYHLVVAIQDAIMYCVYTYMICNDMYILYTYSGQLLRSLLRFGVQPELPIYPSSSPSQCKISGIFHYLQFLL